MCPPKASTIRPGRLRAVIAVAASTSVVDKSDGVAAPDDARNHHLSVASPKTQCRPLARVDEAQSLVAKAGGELSAPAMRLGGDLNDRLAYLQPRPRRQAAVLRSRSR